MDLLKNLREMKESKNSTFSLIAETVLSYTDFSHISLKKLEEDCHVSSATVFRFCKELKISGFSEFKFRLQEIEYINHDIKLTNSIHLSSDRNNHLNNIALSFIGTRDLLTDEMINKVIELIDQSDRINIYGIGSTYLVCRDFELKMERLKRFVKSYNDDTYIFYASKNSSKSTLNIGVTYSGKTETVLTNLTLAKEQGSKTILITSSDNMQFKGQFDVVLFVYSTDSRYRLTTTASRLAMLYLIDLIYFSYLSRDVSENDKILESTKMFNN